MKEPRSLGSRDEYNLRLREHRNLVDVLRRYLPRPGQDCDCGTFYQTRRQMNLFYVTRKMAHIIAI